MKRAWQYVLAEPFTWLFYCFFQPTRFKSDIEVQGLLRRFAAMFRLALPILLISYPLALVMRITLCAMVSVPNHNCLSPGALFVLNSNTGNFFLTITWTAILGIVLGVAGGIIGDIRLGIVLGIALGITGDTDLGIVGGIAIAMGLGVIAGVAGGTTWRVTGGIIGGIVGGVAWALAIELQTNNKAGFQGGIQGGEIAVAFIISYILGYYRIPLYVVSGISGLWTYFASKRKPPEVFTYLRRSALYWDECVYPPLPNLKRTLLLAAEQNSERVQEEIKFIVAYRPQQIDAARMVSLEIAIRDLELRDTMRGIARASHRLAEILPQEVGLIDPRWVTPLARLNDASREAARYSSPLSWQTRYQALEGMVENLKNIYHQTAFNDADLNKRLGEIVNKWLTVARQEQEKLEKTQEKVGQIDNHYKPGQVLESRDSLFVGRRDLVQQLETTLGSGSRRPTFLLTGERRMGKSSTIKQLPTLLGARYLPIIYDLQSRGISSSIDVFLATIAKEIYERLSSRGIRVKKLEYERLKEASRKNEAAVYRSFDEWLLGLERTLEQGGRMLLLVFDEYEKLEEAGQARYFELGLLLDWFRSIIQNRARMALLFSGVRALGEVGASWAGYFVNVQTLRVSFLRPAEARQLITEPVPGFPGGEIFGEDVVEEIVRMTGCHPFLVQAVCSALIDNLNADKRTKASIKDVELAIQQCLENWWDGYFRDMWERTDQEQRVCLFAMRKLGEGDSLAITQQSGLDERTVRHTLQTLLKRDLVVHTGSGFRIAAPIFTEWVERNS